MSILVQGREERDGLCHEEAERTSHVDSKEFVQALTTASSCVGHRFCRLQTLLTHLLGHAPGFALQDDCVSRLRHRHHQQNPESTRDGHQSPEDPAPACIATDVTAHDQRSGRAKCTAQSVHSHRATAGIPLPDITDRSTGVGQRRTTCKTSQEPTDKHGADVRGQGDGHLEETQQEPGHDVDGLTAEVFGQRRQQHRTDCISQDI